MYLPANYRKTHVISILIIIKYKVMNLENIQKVENLIKERNKILEFKSKTSENVGDRFISVNDVQFEAEFLRPIYSQEFVKELNTKISSICDEYVSMIDNQLSEL